MANVKSALRLPLVLFGRALPGERRILSAAIDRTTTECENTIMTLRIIARVRSYGSLEGTAGMSKWAVDGPFADRGWLLFARADRPPLRSPRGKSRADASKSAAMSVALFFEARMFDRKRQECQGSGTPPLRAGTRLPGPRKGQERPFRRGSDTAFSPGGRPCTRVTPGSLFLAQERGERPSQSCSVLAFRQQRTRCGKLARRGAAFLYPGSAAGRLLRGEK
jgi:hypothetical protein